MSGFEMTPFGLVPIGTPSLKDADPSYAAQFVVKADYGNGETLTIGTPESAKLRAAAPEAPVVRAPIKYEIVAAATKAPFSTTNVIAAAKARVKEIKAELKRAKALQKELAELERLLKAAKQKPTPSVRPLRSVG